MYKSPKAMTIAIRTGEVKCVRCGATASAIWRVCADHNIPRPVCVNCDILLNEIVMMFLHDSKVGEKIDVYAKKVKSE